MEPRISMSGICAICGNKEQLIVGRAGIVCKACLAKAIGSVLDAQPTASSQLSADDRCMLCGERSVSRGEYAAFRHPYSICATCMKDGLDAAGGNGATFHVAKF